LAASSSLLSVVSARFSFPTRGAADAGDELPMTIRSRLVLGSLFLGTALLARAEINTFHVTHNRPVSPVLSVLDTNHDGTVSADELAAAPVALAALDLNEDGVISPDERQTLNVAGRPMRVGTSTIAFNLLLALDANHDGSLQALEIANAVSSLEQLDRDGDGQLTPGELRPVMLASNTKP